jgi:hypothetical protein
LLNWFVEYVLSLNRCLLRRKDMKEARVDELMTSKDFAEHVSRSKV